MVMVIGVQEETCFLVWMCEQSLWSFQNKPVALCFVFCVFILLSLSLSLSLTNKYDTTRTFLLLHRSLISISLLPDCISQECRVWSLCEGRDFVC